MLLLPNFRIWYIFSMLFLLHQSVSVSGSLFPNAQNYWNRMRGWWWPWSTNPLINPAIQGTQDTQYFPVWSLNSPSVTGRPFVPYIPVKKPVANDNPIRYEKMPVFPTINPVQPMQLPERPKHTDFPTLGHPQDSYQHNQQGYGQMSFSESFPETNQQMIQPEKFSWTPITSSSYIPTTVSPIYETKPNRPFNSPNIHSSNPAISHYPLPLLMLDYPTAVEFFPQTQPFIPPNGPSLIVPVRLRPNEQPSHIIREPFPPLGSPNKDETVLPNLQFKDSDHQLSMIKSPEQFEKPVLETTLNDDITTPTSSSLPVAINPSKFIETEINKEKQSSTKNLFPSIDLSTFSSSDFNDDINELAPVLHFTPSFTSVLNSDSPQSVNPNIDFRSNEKEIIDSSSQSTPSSLIHSSEIKTASSPGIEELLATSVASSSDKALTSASSAQNFSEISPISENPAVSD